MYKNVLAFQRQLLPPLFICIFFR